MGVKKLALSVLGTVSLVASPAAAAPQTRTTVSLDGTWEVDDGVEPDRPPTTFSHTVPVPGLVHSALPLFPDVDKFTSKQTLSSLVYYDRYSQAAYDKLGDIRGIPGQKRKYFWYHKRFTAPAARATAILKIGKAQFGTIVYLNGVRIGEHDSCFTAGYFDVTRAVRWNAPNELVVRVGAHPGVLPAKVVGGTDFEKSRWTPGIYDSVSLIATDNPMIVSVQAAPRLESATNPVAGVLVQTELRNLSDRPVATDVVQQIHVWKAGGPASQPVHLNVQLAPGQTKLVQQLIALPQAHLWSPEDPFLYRVDTRTAGDSTQTRFGMREFRFDTATQRAYLNGKPYFMRGSNIALHRFFEDPQSGTLPWDDAWVRRLLVDIPKRLHWNAFRFTIGPVPDHWLDVADENGLLIENEYAVWVGSPVYTAWRSSYDVNQMIGEYAEWMRDGWNHASNVIWDATNESWLPEIGSKVIPAVRGLDLSGRPWENSYDSPGDGNDPVEDHHYFTESLGGKFDASAGGKPFELSDLEWMDGAPANPFTKSGHAKILNEYGWMWLNRDGSPTLLTQNLYPKLLGDHDTTANRRALYARLIGGETELWRAYRRYAGVMHFVYLTGSGADAFTSDAFLDVKTLTLEPQFEKAMEQAFRPMGVYLNYWHAAAKAGNEGSYRVYMVNDEGRPRAGKLRLAFTTVSGRQVIAGDTPFSLLPYGAQSYDIALKAPASPGQYRLEATATPDDEPLDPTISIRDVALNANDK